MPKESLEDLVIWEISMNKIGIRAHDLGKMSANDMVKRVHEFGFDGIQLVFKKALIDDVDFSNLRNIKNSLKNTKIMMLGAYFNPVHPDHREVMDGMEYFIQHLKIANFIGTHYVGTETGSLMGSPWGYVKENHDAIRLHQTIEVFRTLVTEAEKNNCFVAIEGAYAHVCYSPMRIRKVLDAINSKNLKVTVDLFNFLHFGNYQERSSIFNETLELLKDDIVIYHLKDFVVVDEKLIQVGLGKGLMDFPTIISKIQELTPNAYLIFEGVIGDDIGESLKNIKYLLERKKENEI